MASRVGSKGQVVIVKEIPDALGIVEGSVAVQRRVGDTVELQFLPPEHERSLRGVLAEYVRTPSPDDPAQSPDDDPWATDAARRDREAVHGDA